MSNKLSAITPVFALLAACSSAPLVQTGEGAEVLGENLHRVENSRSSSSLWGFNNSVSNQADVRRMFSSWATQINNSLARVTSGD